MTKPRVKATLPVHIIEAGDRWLITVGNSFDKMARDNAGVPMTTWTPTAAEAQKVAKGYIEALGEADAMNVTVIEWSFTTDIGRTIVEVLTA